jgi:hypothetical protein
MLMRRWVMLGRREDCLRSRYEERGNKEFWTGISNSNDSEVTDRGAESVSE